MSIKKKTVPAKSKPGILILKARQPGYSDRLLFELHRSVIFKKRRFQMIKVRVIKGPYFDKLNRYDLFAHNETDNYYVVKTHDWKNVYKDGKIITEEVLILKEDCMVICPNDNDGDGHCERCYDKPERCKEVWRNSNPSEDSKISENIVLYPIFTDANEQAIKLCFVDNKGVQYRKVGDNFIAVRKMDDTPLSETGEKITYKGIFPSMMEAGEPREVTDIPSFMEAFNQISEAAAKELWIKIKPEWWNRYLRTSSGKLKLDEVKVMKVHSEYYETNEGVPIDKNHADVLGGMIITPEGNFKIVGEKLISCDEHWNPILSTNEVKDSQPIDTNDVIYTEKDSSTKKVGYSEEEGMNIIRKWEGNKKIELVDRVFMIVPPSEQDVKDWLKEHEEEFGFDHNARLLIWAFYYWTKSQKN